ncbi:MAG: hypothetical protein R3A45_03845 [Bdellovibrionota bacterium]
MVCIWALGGMYLTVCQAFEYVFDQNTVLSITHYEIYNQDQRIKADELVQHVLENDGVVFVNYQPPFTANDLASMEKELLKDVKDSTDIVFLKKLLYDREPFISRLKKLYPDYINKHKLILIESRSGEMLKPMRMVAGKKYTGISLEMMKKVFPVNKDSHIYVIGNYLTACHTNSLFDVLYRIRQANLDVPPTVEIDLLMTTYVGEDALLHLSADRYIDQLRTYPEYDRKIDQVMDLVVHKIYGNSVDEDIARSNDRGKMPDHVIYLHYP